MMMISQIRLRMPVGSKIMALLLSRLDRFRLAARKLPAG
jgi:hypothetical protein